jgi:uncharacterized protein YjbI with pentapeptide repeats
MGAQLMGVDMGRSCLRGANLGGADLRNAILRGADLTGASLRGASLSGAIVDRHTKLSGARSLNRTGLIDLDLVLQRWPHLPTPPRPAPQL